MTAIVLPPAFSALWSLLSPLARRTGAGEIDTGATLSKSSASSALDRSAPAGETGYVHAPKVRLSAGG